MANGFKWLSFWLVTFIFGLTFQSDVVSGCNDSKILIDKLFSIKSNCLEFNFFTFNLYGLCCCLNSSQLF